MRQGPKWQSARISIQAKQFAWIVYSKIEVPGFENLTDFYGDNFIQPKNARVIKKFPKVIFIHRRELRIV